MKYSVAKIFYIALLLLLLPGAIGFCQEREEALKLLKEGNSFHRGNKFTDAPEKYRTALHVARKVGDCQTESEVQRKIGTCYRFLNMENRAMDFYACKTEIGNNQNHLDNILDIARKTRPAPEFIDHIVDYTIDNDMKKSIKNLLEKSVGQTFEESNIQPSNKGLPGGNPLFLVRDSQGNLKYTVKIFHLSAPWNTFTKELSGLQLASTIHSKVFCFVSAQAVGKCRVDNNLYGLLATAPPAGESLAGLVSKISSTRQDSAERAEAFHNIQRAFGKLGAAFAELHNMRTEKKQGVHPAILKYGKELLCAKPLTSRSYGIDPMMLQKYFYSLANSASNTEIKRSYAHGDIILDNFIYDAKSDSLTMINLAFFSDSADQEGNPIQNAIFDYIGLIEQIEQFKNSPDITKKEYREIKEAFLSAYGSPPAEGKGEEFFTLLYRLAIVFWTSEILDWKTDSSEEVKSWLEPSLDNIRKMLSTYQESIE
ncbi:MAG: hypothetical protein K8T10_02105 [Candidatus Eremiobacteraeota bacterium]|nr:hypothetical protein [Candidatus Eremiobacteraeota bacterium]